MPPLVAVILVENIGSSIVSTMLAKEFLVAYKKHIDAEAALASNVGSDAVAPAA